MNQIIANNTLTLDYKKMLYAKVVERVVIEPWG